VLSKTFSSTKTVDFNCTKSNSRPYFYTSTLIKFCPLIPAVTDSSNRPQLDLCCVRLSDKVGRLSEEDLPLTVLEKLETLQKCFCLNYVYRLDSVLQVQFYKSNFTSPILQVQFFKSNFTSPILQVQFYKSNFTSPILQVQFYKSNFTSFARSTTEQMPALVFKKLPPYILCGIRSHDP
jgi:hypothetical protein